MRLWGQSIRLEATLDYWDDQNDIYAIKPAATNRST